MSRSPATPKTTAAVRGHGWEAGVVIGCVALLTAYAAAPGDAARAAVWVLAGGCAAGAILAGVHRTRPANPYPSWLLAISVCLLATGQADALRDAPASAYRVGLPLLAYLLLAAAAAGLAGDRDGDDRASLLDALVVTVAAAQVGWVLLLEPTLRDDASGLGGIALTSAHDLGYLLVIAVLARLGFAVAGTRDTAAHLLIGGIGLGLGTDVVSTLLGDSSGALWVAAGWLVSFGAIVVATTHPTMATPPAAAPAVARLSSAWRFAVLLGLACLVSPVLVLTHAGNGGTAKAVVVLGSAIMLFVLAVLRVVSVLDSLRRGLRREHVLRQATSSLVSAADRAAVRDAALGAVLDLLDQPGSRAWRIDTDPGGTVAQATDDEDVATFLDVAELALLPGPREGISVLRGPTLLHATLGVPSTLLLVLVALPARGLARAAAAIATTTQPSAYALTALHTLASTIELALDRLDVGEIMIERRSERRLRLMLRYASDVIAILDLDLTIVHVTPAVEPIVGLPAPELLGLSWLDVVVPEDRDAARDLVSLAQGGRPARGELRLACEDGLTRYVDAVVTEVMDEGLTGFVVTCHDITQRYELEQQLTHQAFHDSLTGLANRALFRDRLGHAMARSGRHGDFGVLFVDLDDFKTINDSLGHAAGDALLRETTSRLLGCLRAADTAARLGGDEFAIVLEDTDRGECARIAGRLLAALRVPFEVQGSEVTTGASIGIALGPVAALLDGPASSAEDIMRNADLALYDAKNRGKNCYSIFAPQMHQAVLERLALTSDLRHAITRDQLVVYYQPLVALDTGDVIGLEALVRWQHPDRGLLQPAEFIELAEESGLIVALGRSVLRTALGAAATWQRLHPDHAALLIAINVSGRQLQDPGFVGDVASILSETGIDAATVVLEITESILLPGEATILDRLNALAALGLSLYVDDFGTGYSSLAYLQALPVSGLKLAREFVDALPGTRSESGLVRTIRDLADTLGLTTVIAEGIERSEQWTSLVAMGYHVGQGYHLALPMPAERVTAFLTGERRAGDTPWDGAANDLPSVDSVATTPGVRAADGHNPPPRKALSTFVME